MNPCYVMLFILLPYFSVGASNGTLLHVEINPSDKASLQRGAKYYMNYCSGCHSLKYLRYKHLAKGLDLVTFDGDIDEDLLFSNLVFTKAHISSPIEVALSKLDAKSWFGKVPPDLTLMAKVRGADWLYTFLNSFYFDSSRPFNSNNSLFPDLAMPNVLAPLQGKQILIAHNSQSGVFKNIQAGEKSTAQFHQLTKDVVNFLSFVAEPEKAEREYLGLWVLLFLIVLTLLLYALKSSYWNDIEKKTK